mmetsp:Transcript_122835/g.342282  ORF Transcript_122835/g.342282 Transcript_122835/m.342282 type:complete len:248 (-) Transcript_122835:931-1674(-)
MSQRRRQSWIQVFSTYAANLAIECLKRCLTSQHIFLEVAHPPPQEGLEAYPLRATATKLRPEESCAAEWKLQVRRHAEGPLQKLRELPKADVPRTVRTAGVKAPLQVAHIVFADPVLRRQLGEPLAVGEPQALVEAPAVPFEEALEVEAAAGCQVPQLRADLTQVLGNGPLGPALDPQEFQRRGLERCDLQGTAAVLIELVEDGSRQQHVFHGYLQLACNRPQLADNFRLLGHEDVPGHSAWRVQHR